MKISKDIERKDAPAVCFNARMLGVVSAFRAINDIRYYLAGVLVRPCKHGGVLLCATDGHQMAIAFNAVNHWTRGDDGNGVIVSRFQQLEAQQYLFISMPVRGNDAPRAIPDFAKEVAA